jgi:hypothetical protein
MDLNVNILERRVGLMRNTTKPTFLATFPLWAHVQRGSQNNWNDKKNHQKDTNPHLFPQNPEGCSKVKITGLDQQNANCLCHAAHEEEKRVNLMPHKLIRQCDNCQENQECATQETESPSKDHTTKEFSARFKHMSMHTEKRS